MPGFLSEYDATETLTFGPDKEWWVKVKKHLQRGAYGAAQTALVQPIMKYVGTTAETAGDVDTVSYQDVLVFHGIVEWNLTDRDGALLPLETDDERRASIAQLPEEVFEAIVAVIAPAAPKAAANGKGDSNGKGDDATDTFPETVVLAALRGSGPAPRELADYQTERAFWSQLGVSPDRLQYWPEAKVERYIAIMNATAAFEAAEAALERQRAEASQRGKSGKRS